ncbi:MAG TPA: GAF domain-containing sensor histidine kinase [Gemmatimonadaceae bacterium]|nr:GAF domain-containing sensor histidine kinase [Gemmatimonadaceae bacterium]
MKDAAIPSGALERSDPGQPRASFGFAGGSPTAARMVDRRRPERRALFLADITRTLHDSLDYEQTLSTVARLAMPELGAWCIVDVLEDGVIRRLAVIHPDPNLEPLARELQQGYPPASGDILGAPRIIDTQQPELVAEVSETMLLGSAMDHQHLEILRKLGLESYMVIPLKARDRLLGCITFISARGGQKYTPKDLLFGEDLAGRAAVAMDNARLYQEAERAKEEALEAVARATLADRAKTDFLAAMSHELRTPLNAIAGYAELLELGMRGPVTEQQRQAIERIRKSQQHLLGIVNDILTLAKTETGRVPLQIEQIDVNEILLRVHFLMEPLFAACEIQYSFVPCDSPVSLTGDRDRVQQILVNLLSNAVKFSPRGAPVTVDCEVREHLIAIRIKDSGSGIAREKQEIIFEPFVQLSAGLTRTAEGSGLGLAISRELARVMGGDVMVESTPGRGSTFTLTLPLSPRIAALT